MARLTDVAGKTLQTIIARVNKLWSSMFTSLIKTTVVANDEFLIKDSAEAEKFKTVKASAMFNYFGNISVSDSTGTQLLFEWAQGKDYEPITITRDSEGRVTTMTVKWPDGSSGTYTATDYNATHEVYDGYTVTHSDSGIIVEQEAVTRNSEGAIITKPALTI